MTPTNRFDDVTSEYCCGSRAGGVKCAGDAVTAGAENTGRGLLPDSEPSGRRADANKSEGEGRSCTGDSMEDEVLISTRGTLPSNER